MHRRGKSDNGCDENVLQGGMKLSENKLNTNNYYYYYVYYVSFWEHNKGVKYTSMVFVWILTDFEKYLLLQSLVEFPRAVSLVMVIL